MPGFIARNKADWDELESLVRRARKSVRRLSPEELSRLDVLYRRTTVHLSQVLTRTSDAQLAQYLNDLTAWAHAVIYVPPKRSMTKGALTFIVSGFGRAIARNWKFHAIAAVLVVGGAVLAYYAAMNDVLATYALLMPGDPRLPGSTQEQLLEFLRSERDTSGGGKFLFASFLFSHNLKVGLLSVGTGALAGVPTVLLMLYNGMMLGAFTAVHHNAGIVSEYWAWILPHGITEIGAIILCGGVGLLLGKSIVSPGLLSRPESLRRAGREAAQICLGVAGMLVAAALVESYLRQSHLSTTARLAFAAGSAVFWALYIAHGFLREHSDRAEADQSQVVVPEHDKVVDQRNRQLARLDVNHVHTTSPH